MMLPGLIMKHLLESKQGQGSPRAPRSALSFKCSLLLEQEYFFENVIDDLFNLFLEEAPSFLEKRRRSHRLSSIFSSSDHLSLPLLQVAMLEKRTEEEEDLWKWKTLTLTEILRDLQIGKGTVDVEEPGWSPCNERNEGSLVLFGLGADVS